MNFKFSKKTICILFVLLMVFISLGTVSAMEINSTDDNADLAHDPLELENDDVKLSISNDENILSSAETFNGTTFSDLGSKINSLNNGDVLDLTSNVTQDGTGQINISKSITINGNGVIIDAQGKSRIFYINTNATVVLNNITFTNGYESGNGGAIYFNGSGSVENCNFINNKALGNGGATYMSNALSDSKINSTFINNSAKNGGAIYFNDAITNVTINGSFKENTAERAGGAIYVKGKSMNNSFSSEFYDNQARQASGGAIFFYTLSESNIFESIYIKNYALYGGGVFFYKKANNNKFNSDFNSNVAKSCGGAIFFYNTTNNNSFTGNFINNSALGEVDETNGNGGAITFKDVSTNCVFTCDFINNNATKNGGGVNYRQTPHNITFNGNFINNTSPNGGGVNFFVSFENIIFNCEFIGNSAKNGGAIAAGEGIIKDVSFKDNKAEKGGAVYFAGYGETINCNFTNNTASDYGGALEFNGTGSVTNCNFTGNNATAGSAIHFNNENVAKTISNSYFLNNKADTEDDTPLQVVWNGNNVEIIFFGKDNLLNAIYSPDEVNFTNVTYWGANGIANTDSTDPIISNKEAGQNITIRGIVDGKILDTTKTTDADGKIILENVSGNYFILVRHNDDTYYTEAEIIVNKVPAKITVIDELIDLYVNDTISDFAALTPGDAGTLNYTSSNEDVAKIVDGKIIAVGAGKAKITVSFEGNDNYTAAESKNIYVIVKPLESRISVNKTEYELIIGDEADIIANATPEGLVIDYATDDDKIISVDDNGHITALGNGTAIIFVSVGDNYIYDYAYVNVIVTVKKTTEMDVNVSADENNVTITATVDSSASGLVKFNISGKVVYVDVNNGKAVYDLILPAGDYNVEATYMGDETYTPTNSTYSFNVTEDTVDSRLGSQFNVTEGKTIETYAVDFQAGERGTTFQFQLTDSNGKPIANASVQFAYKTVIFNRTTDENGIVFLGVSTQFADSYLCALSYLGDEKHNATFVAFNFKLNKKPITITAKAKTFKVSTKTKKYTITLKTDKCASKDGKTYLKSGKKVTLKVNGKTYTAKINAQGQVTFKITNLNKKGKFTAAINFAGDKTYKAASKKVIITVK